MPVTRVINEPLISLSIKPQNLSAVEPKLSRAEPPLISS